MRSTVGRWSDRTQASRTFPVLKEFSIVSSVNVRDLIAHTAHDIIMSRPYDTGSV